MKRSTFLSQLFSIPFAVWSRSRGTQLPANGVMLNHFFIAGLQYHGWETISHLMSKDSELHLNAEPHNPYDAYAVGIYARDTRIGYVPRNENRHISRMIQGGISLSCSITLINEEAPSWRKVRVEIRLGTRRV